jgi:hypothetical protein
MPIEPETSYQCPETGTPWMLVDIVGGEALLVSPEGDTRKTALPLFHNRLRLGLLKRMKSPRVHDKGEAFMR